MRRPALRPADRRWGADAGSRRPGSPTASEQEPQGTTLTLYGGHVWEVVLLDEVSDWFLALDRPTANLVAAAIDRLAAEGPSLGRPLVDRVKNSSRHNMKELRPGSRGRSEVRILFVFDPGRQAVLLVAGDKAGRWSDWYRSNIPIAEARYDEWLRGERAEET